MLVLIKNEHQLEEQITQGNAFVEAGNLVFANLNEAEEYGNIHFGHGNFKVYPLCDDCQETDFIRVKILKYPTMGKLLKRMKVAPNQ